MLKDRTRKPIVSHRIACGRPGRPPVKLDFLEITTNELPAPGGVYAVDESAMAALRTYEERRYFREVKDDKTGKVEFRPRRIPVRCPSDDIADFAHQRYESRAVMDVLDHHGQTKKVVPKNAPFGMTAEKWVAAGNELVVLQRAQVWCHGDGVTAHRLAGDRTEREIRCCHNPRTYPPRDPKDQLELLRRKRKHDDTDGKQCPWAQNRDKDYPTCPPTTELLLYCDVVSNIGALCRVRSHGHETADRLAQSLDDIKAAIPGGILAGVPLDLVLDMKLMPVPGRDQMALQPTMRLELRIPIEATVRLLNANLQQHAQLVAHAREVKGLLAASRDEHVEAEFPSTPSQAPLLEREQASGGAFKAAPAAPAAPTPEPEVLPPEREGLFGAGAYQPKPDDTENR